MSSVDVTKIVDEALRKFQRYRVPPAFQPPMFPPSPYYQVPANTMRGVPVIVLGRDPPYAGDLLGYQPELYNGEEYMRLQLGWVEVWAQVRDQENNVVAYYPYYVRGMPSIGAIAAHEHARAVGGSIILFEVGINEPFGSVVVPARSVLWLDKVFEGKMRVIVADPAGILVPAPYDAATRMYQLQELVRSYAYNVHVLDYEVRRLQGLLQAKDVEVRKYRDLADEQHRMYMNLLGQVTELQYEVDRMETYLRQMEMMHVADKDFILEMSRMLANMRRVLSDMSSTLQGAQQVITRHFTEALTDIMSARQGKKATAKPAQAQPPPAAPPATAPAPPTGGGYVPTA